MPEFDPYMSLQFYTSSSLQSVLRILNPLLSYVTFVVNIVVIFIFTKKMQRRPTTIIIIGIAISDTLTGLTKHGLGPFFKLYNTDEPEFSVKYPMCFIDMIFDCLSPVFHSVSTLYTTVLGVQRLIVIACPFRGPHYVTMKTSYICVFVIPIVCLLINSPRFYLYNSLRRNEDTLSYFDADSCIVKHPETAFIINIYCIYANTVITIICSFIMLIISIYLAVNFQCNKMLSTRTVSAEEQITRKRNTIMIIIILITFVIAEMPRLTTFWCASDFLTSKASASTCTSDYAYVLHKIETLCFQAGACMNIIIYILMSKEFRSAFASSLCCLCRCRGNINRPN